MRKKQQMSFQIIDPQGMGPRKILGNRYESSNFWKKNANIENINLNLLLPIRIFFFLSQQIHFGNKTRGTTDYVLFTEI